MNQNFKKFIAEDVELSGSNLIEASAGTGKTYSIAIMVLRLILEKNILIQDILMVTFTNAAVAELEERIRKFVRQAYRYAEGGECGDETIKKIVDRIDREEAKSRLKLAVLNLDETSVMTIHGFCQQTLTEFAFETGQLFSSELVADDSQMLEAETQKFWRKNITGINKELLSFLIGQKLNLYDIQSIVKNHLSGKNYIFYDENKEYSLDEKEFEEDLKTISELSKSVKKIDESLNEYVKTNFDQLIEVGQKNSYINKNFLNEPQTANSLLEKISGKSNLQNVKKTYPEICDFLNEINGANDQIALIIEELINELYAFAIQEISTAVTSYKLSHNLLSYDDLILNLHKALTNQPNPKLENELRRKYKAVFIDEFQDTDREQYEIFKTAFQNHQDAVIFYIGDPKQSIYAWRKADIATYFKARNSVENIFEMNTNYRSTAPLIQAMNQFFLPNEDFDTFRFIDEKDKINYIKVDAPSKSDKGSLLIDNQECLPISITNFPNKDEVFVGVAQQVLDLLTSEKHSIYDKKSDKNRKIRPSDIGILVRGKKTGNLIKSQLSKLGIPAVTVSDTKILNTEEATELIYILEAMLEFKRTNINRALKSIFINLSAKEIQNLDEEAAVNKFKKYNENWQLKGIYTTLTGFAKDFELRAKLLDETESGERILTNFYHLSEILYKAESRQHLSPEELTDWLKKNKSKSQSSDDEMVQRIESDENAVNITTIHSSKGLEYPIVLAPDLDMVYQYWFDIINLRMEDGNYVTGKRSQFEALEKIDEHKIQEEQENRRLIYVAITRAIYKCFIYRNTHYRNSSLTVFTNEITENDLIAYVDSAKPEFNYYEKENQLVQTELSTEKIEFKENNWQQMSYSGLSAHLDQPAKENYLETEENYDKFIFRDLRRGAQTGNFLHFIFENLNFSNPDNWQYAIEKAIARFNPAKKGDEKFDENIREFLHHVMNAELNTGREIIKLSSVYQSQMLHELGFDFPVKLFEPKQLENLMDYGLLVSNYYTMDRKEIEGMMTGFIDLFFEYKGKYFVLDWKSNYLGPSLEDYSSKKIWKAMSDNNYHLQYLIYSLAVKKYLKSRLGENFDFEKQFGGVFYLFVRGMRAGQDSGVFYYKPAVEKMAEMEKIFE